MHVIDSHLIQMIIRYQHDELCGSERGRYYFAVFWYCTHFILYEMCVSCIMNSHVP